MEVVRLCALGLVGLAAVTDLRSRRIPNVLTFGGAAVALVYHVVTNGLHGITYSAGGWAVGVGLFLPMFLLKGMGAGDVKLLGAVGAWLGAIGAVWAALFSVFAGGVLAIVVALAHGYLRQALVNVWGMLGFWRTTGVRPLTGLTLDDAVGPRLPYALAIAAGTAASVLLK